MSETTLIGRLVCLLTLPVLMFAWADVVSSAQKAGPAAGDGAVRQILEDAAVTGGLIVHLGCGDGRLTAALHADQRCVVHGLDTDEQKIERARRYIQQRGLYGPVSVEPFDGTRLPHADGLVNLLVVSDRFSVDRGEMRRVLCPGGKVVTLATNGQLRATGQWVKPWPKNIDQWTHYLHDASGNAVAHDEVVGPPCRVQWIADPRHTRSHEHTPSVNAMVSAGGRLFYIADEAPVVSIRRPPQWHLIARDAFNGLLLWKRPLAAWFPHIVNWGTTPRQLQRRLVAVGNRVYVTLGLHAPLSALDAGTGKTIKIYENTEGTEEILWHKGILLLVIRRVTDQRVAELAKWERLAREDGSPLYARKTAQPLVDRWRAVQRKADKAVLAVDAETGRWLWNRTGPDAAGLRALSLCASGNRVFYQRGPEVVCLDLATGRQRWSAAASPLRLACRGVVVCANGQGIQALSAETGRPLWTQSASLVDIRDVFVAGGSLWLGGFRPCPGKRSPAWGPYLAVQRDLATGKMQRQIEPPNPGHHHRCYLNKATDRYIFGGRRGVELFDLASGEVLWHSWVRGVCKYGVMPCNGLLYAPPHACACYIAAKLEGFYALAPKSASGVREVETSADARWQRGPAYDPSGSESPRSDRAPDDWPTYRHDPARSGAASSPVAAALGRRWQAAVGGRLSAPTVAGGKVFVASVDEHRVEAVDADTGQPVWRFTAGGRVDSPPTLDGGRAIFGCRDGYVYSVRASDGVLAWRLRVARRQRRVVARGQLESASPALGSILIEDGVAYVTAGRSSYLDGGIDLCRIEPRSGKVLSRTPIYSPDPQTGRQPEQFGPAAMPGALADILSADRGHVFLRDMVFDEQGKRLPEGPPHLFSLTGFLDHSWAHRSYWIFGTRCSVSCGCSRRDKQLVYGRLLVFDDAMIYGFGRRNVHWSNQLQDGPYRLFAVGPGETAVRWEKPLAIQVRAMVLAGKILFAAGPRAEAVFAPTAPAGSQPAVLLALSASDGDELARYPLDSSPVWDGMAAARGRLFITLENGRLVCLDQKRS